MRLRVSRRPRRVVGRKRRGMRRLPGRSKARVPRAVKTFVKKEIHKNIENKFVSIYADGEDHNSPISSSVAGNDFYPLVPPVYEGTGQNQRLGKVIRPTGLYVKGQLQLAAEFNDIMLGNQQVYKPIVARVIIFRQKNVTSCYNSGNVNLTSLLKANFSAVNGTAGSAPAGWGADDSPQPFHGYVHDLLIPVNKEQFDVAFDRKFTLVPNLMENLTAGSPSIQTEPGFVQPSVRSNYQEYSIKLPIHKVLKFDENSAANWPIGTAWWVAVGYAYTDGTSPDQGVNGYSQLQHRAIATMYYEDA